MSQNKKQFDIALSFAGEDRTYVEKVAYWLKKMGYKVFYDKYEKVSLWGKDLYAYLIEIYQKKARYAVLFGSKFYAKKVWTNHERRAAQAKALRSNRDYILPARFDSTAIPGVLSTTGYIELQEYSPKQFALLIKEKVGRVPRKGFFPEEPNLLYKGLQATSNQKKEIAENCAFHFFGALQLMTIEERKLLAIVFENTCPAGPPNNVHHNIELYGRIAKLTPDEIISKLSRLDCLGIEIRLKNGHKQSDIICSSKRTLFVRYCPLAEGCPNNGTGVVVAIFKILSDRLCPSCRKGALRNLDFSFLSSLAGFPD